MVLGDDITKTTEIHPSHDLPNFAFYLYKPSKFYAVSVFMIKYKSDFLLHVIEDVFEVIELSIDIDKHAY